jgi:L-2-hydroxyglutarate oxidase LhgO
MARVVVIGAGVVGLACAARLAEQGHAVTLVERHGRVGQETSSRSSEVVHAGLYNPTGWLKTLTCVEGRELLYAYCAARGVAHRKIGKLVVAVDESEREALTWLYFRARENAVSDVRLVERDELAELEPEVRGVLGLLSPSTGIVDAYGLMESLRRDALGHGARIVLQHVVTAIGSGTRPHVHARGERGDTEELAADWVVNSAGLAADHIAALSGVDVEEARLHIKPCKGDYFTLAPELKGLTQRLVYPLAQEQSLGIHITHSLSGALRAGPDASYVAVPSYEVSPHKAAMFAEALARFLPRVEAHQLTPAYAGVRAKLAGPGEQARDFVCEVLPEAPRVVQLVGIESPGLTAALSLARLVAEHIAAG